MHGMCLFGIRHAFTFVDLLEQIRKGRERADGRGEKKGGRSFTKFVEVFTTPRKVKWC